MRSQGPHHYFHFLLFVDAFLYRCRQWFREMSILRVESCFSDCMGPLKLWVAIRLNTDGGVLVNRGSVVTLWAGEDRAWNGNQQSSHGSGRTTWRTGQDAEREWRPGARQGWHQQDIDAGIHFYLCFVSTYTSQSRRLSPDATCYVFRPPYGREEDSAAIRPSVHLSVRLLSLCLSHQRCILGLCVLQNNIITGFQFLSRLRTLPSISDFCFCCCCFFISFCFWTRAAPANFWAHVNLLISDYILGLSYLNRKPHTGSQLGIPSRY